MGSRTQTWRILQFANILDNLREYSRKAKLESNAAYANSNDDMDCGNIKRQKEAEDKHIKEEADKPWWEYIEEHQVETEYANDVSQV